jgi:hypothetical protein
MPLEAARKDGALWSGQSCYLMPGSDEGKLRIAGKSPKMGHTEASNP